MSSDFAIRDGWVRLRGVARQTWRPVTALWLVSVALAKPAGWSPAKGTTLPTLLALGWRETQDHALKPTIKVVRLPSPLTAGAHSRRVLGKNRGKTVDFVDRLRAISNRIQQQQQHLHTEEATKMALVVPFLSALGWDVYNPLEVVPEFTADVGTKRGEKVDYAIMREGTPILLVECKKVGVSLEKDPASQLYRYFSVTKARVGILTDGIHYRFFSDLEEPNKMDSKPFLVLDMGNFDEARVPSLKRFSKDGFDIEQTISAAVEMKYTAAIKQWLTEQAADPSEETIRFFAGAVYDGRMTQNAKEQFRGVVRRALAGWVNDAVAKRLKTALGEEIEEEASVDETPELPAGVVSIDGDVVTTQEEMDAFAVVKAIVAGTLPVGRVVMRDTKTYCSILIDDNNRRPLCRFWFNGKKQKYLGLLDETKKETKHPIESIDDLYQHAESLRDAALRYIDA